MMLPAYASCWCLSPCERFSVTREPYNLTIVAEYFFIHLPLVVGHMAVLEPSRAGGEAWSHGTCGDPIALPSRETGSRATGRVVAPEPSHAGRRGSELWDAWQHQSPPAHGGWVQCRGTSANALLHALLLALTWSLYA
jgi:hypothetical protein